MGKSFRQIPSFDELMGDEPKKKIPSFNEVMGDVEKKSQVGGVDTKLNGGGQESLNMNDLDNIKAFVTGKTVEEVKSTKQANMKPPAKISNVITQTNVQKPSAKSVKEEAEHKLTQIADEDLTDPIKGINKLSQTNPTNPKDILATEKAKEMLVGRMAQDGFDAKELLNRSFFGMAEDDNQTSRVLREKAADYDKSVAPLRNIQVGDLTGATPEYLDNALTPQIKNAAIQYGAQKDPQFAKELQVMGLDLNDPDLFGKVGSFKSGQWMQRFLQDENVGTFLNKENPNLMPAIDRAYNQIRVDNLDYGINSVANEVSQAVQKSGFNNIDPIFNYYGDNHKEYADQVARDIYKNDPQSLAIWDKYIKDDQEKYMDAPSLMQGFAEGGEGVFKGIANTFTEPFRNASESTKRRWDKEALNVSANPEGIFKIIRETGRVGGLVAAISGTGNVLGAGGTGLYAQKIVPALSGGVLPFFGDSLEEGRAKYPDSPVKAGLSALVNTAMYAALSQQLFPAKSINQAIGKVSPDINNIVERLASGQISREAARQQANTAFKRALDFTGGSLSKAGKITAELTAIKQFNKGLDKIMMDDEEFKNYHPEKDESDETITLFLSNIALGGFSKFGDMKKRNRVAEESYYELASNPKKYERMIDNLSVDKSFGTIQEFKENLKFISGIKTELDALRINPKDQKRFIFEALKEKSAKETSESASDSSVQQKNKDVIKQAKEVKEKILAGEDAETIVTESQQKEIDKQKETEVKIERLIIDNELDNKKYDKQREGLDGRSPEDKIKIEKIEEDRRRANEDFKTEMEKLKPTPKLPGIYGDLYKSNPEAVLKDIAEQAQGVDANGNPLEGGSRKDDMIKQGFSEEIINEAIAKYPIKESSSTPMESTKEGTAENVVPSTSVIMPGEIQRPETTTITPKENVVEPKAKISVILPKNESKETTSEIPITTEETKPINEEPNKEGSGTGQEPPTEVGSSGGVFVERPATELSFRGLQNVANEFGYEDVKSRDRVSDIKEKQNARETALEWAKNGVYEKNINELLSNIEKRDVVPTARQRLMLQDYLANESQKLRELKGKEGYGSQFEKVKRIKQIGQIARQEAGAALRIGGERSHPVADYADAAITMAEAIGTPSLNEKQQAEVGILVKNYEQKAKDAEAKVTELEAKLSEMEAAKEVAKTASVKKGTKKTAEQYKDERAKFREELKAAKAEHDKWLKEQGISKMGVGLTLTPKMIKAISRIAGSHIEEIGNNIKEVTKRVFDEVKDYFDDITERDVHDIISGKYGDDYNKLFNVKQQIEKTTIDLQSKTAAKDFEKQEKVAWAKNKELKAKYPKLYKETLDALAAKEDAKLDYDKALAREELAKLKGRKRLGYLARGVISTSKAVASGIDFSGIMMQNLVAMVAHPRSAAKSLPASFVDMASDKSFTRWLTELHNSKEWEDIEKSGLSITDPKSLKEGGKDEPFSGNLLDKEFKIKGKKYQISKYMTKPFERQFTSLGNRMRVNMFLRITDRWKDQGKTFETDPESYKSLARVLNTETGRGGVPEAIEKAHGLVNSVIWSPKLMASRLNILGISDIGALVGGKGYYTDLSPEIRKMALLDLVKFIGAGTALMGFAAALGADTDDDPRSPKFGTITVGNKSYNAWGGFTPYVKTIYQSARGERLSAGQERPTTTGELLMKFARSKMTPFAGAVTSAAYKKDYSGKPTTIGQEALKSVTPLSIKGILEGLQQDGVMGIITQGIPSIVGVGVTDQRDFQKSAPSIQKQSKQSGRQNQRKQTKAK